jgi:hypothetical protein
MNLNLVNIPNDFLTGFGIYAISYRDQTNPDSLIYLGSYAGNTPYANNSKSDPRERWVQHIGTATLLQHANLQMKHKGNKIYWDHRKNSELFFQNNPSHKEAAENSFINLPEHVLEQYIFLPNNTQVSKNRLGFALQNLSSTHKKEANTLEELQEIIKRFTCYYWKITPNPFTLISKDKKSLVDPLKACESSIIHLHKERLPLNQEYKASTSLNRKHYHYDPETLIKVNKEGTDKLSDEFNNLSILISKSLCETFP